MKNKELYIIIGPMGANKTIYSETIANLFNMTLIFWAKIGAENGKNKKKDKFKILEEHLIRSFKKSPHVIIDGFPTDKEDALFLLSISKKLNYKIKCVIQLNISLRKIIQNLKNRFVCNNCGVFYEKDKITDKKGNSCPNCGSVLIKYHINEKGIKKDYYNFFDSITAISEILSLYAESYFSVSVEQPKHFVISSIFQKIKNQEKNIYTLYEKKSQTKLKTKSGTFDVITYLSKVDYKHHLAIIKGNVKQKTGVLLRIHSSCITGDVFGSLKCDCGQQLQRAIKIIEKSKLGVLIYLYQEGRGINIINKIEAYNLQNNGADTVEANELLKLPTEMREYSAVKDILADLEIKSVRILTNNPDKLYKLEELGVVVESMVPLEIKSSKHNKKYLLTKKNRMGHKFKMTI
ncbi:MAG: 3,4-dihydroxy 2-butanone 4-phosphate synthase / GTP cyclohydrolase II [Parcubacteria group bacterium Licking1014_1]|nr:MAG: 3,4-dihydroxy 2-butanone 4-phosphate synthase / GTP cyclohydrolase II [Parcubacteria group bacterium Licking1014_1]